MHKVDRQVRVCSLPVVQELRQIKRQTLDVHEQLEKRFFSLGGIRPDQRQLLKEIMHS